MVGDNSKYSKDNEYDKEVLIKRPNLEGAERIITLDYMYDKYKNDMEDPVTEPVFKNRITLIYNDLYDPNGKTRRFGGRKKYLSSLRYDKNKNNTDAIIIESKDH